MVMFVLTSSRCDKNVCSCIGRVCVLALGLKSIRKCMQNCDMPSSISKYLRLKENVKVVNRQRKEKVLVAADSESTSHKHLIRHLFCKRCLFSLGSYHIELIVCILVDGDWNYQCWQWCFHEVCWQWFLS